MSNKRKKKLKLIDVKSEQTAYKKVCPICERKSKAKTSCCMTCNKKIKQLNETYHQSDSIVNRKNKHSGKLSIVKFLHRMEQKKMIGEELFSYIYEMPEVRFNEIARPLSHERAHAMKNAGKNREYNRKQLQENPYFNKGDYSIPDYIKVIFSKRLACELLAVSGNYNELTIHYKCLRCNEEHLVLESNPTAGHNCTSVMSSYEYLVNDFLKEKGYHFVSQHKTLRCVNPTTNMQLPYDFQLINEKLIIEVQGEQHYKFVEIFHRNEEGFKYQRWKDEYKKNYALNRGFDYLEIRYDEFENNKYEDMILEKVTNRL